MKRQTLAIILILIAGGTSTAFAVTNGSIITGDLTVTGTCSGCGGSEADYTTYSLVTNSTLSGTAGVNYFKIDVANDGSNISQDTSGNVRLIGLNGTVFNTYTSWASTGWKTFDISESGKYKIVLNNGDGIIKVFKNNVLIQSITINTTNSFSDTHGAVGISHDGKYIEFINSDLSAASDRLQVWQGA